MVYCNKCGSKNDDDAQYCNKCGNFIGKESTFEKNIENAAEEFGRKAEQFGRLMEKKARAFAKSDQQSSESKEKYCSDCKLELNYDASYCWKCGKKI